VRNAADFGVVITAPASINFSAVQKHWKNSQETIYQHDDSPEVLASKGVETRMRTEAVFVSRNVVELRTSSSLEEDDDTRAAAGAAPVVTTTQCRADKFILCVGAHPVLPFSSIAGLESVGCVTSDTLWSTLGEFKELPKGLVVLGGGPIGCEIAQAFARLGTKVSLVGSVLPREEAEARTLVAAALEHDGVTVLHGRCKAVHNEQQGSSGGGGGGSVGRTVKLVLKVAGQEEERTISGVAADVVLCALGRSASPSLEKLKLDKVGVTAAAAAAASNGPMKGLELDKYLRCSGASHVFACGDCVGGAQFTHLAGYQV
jgi:pyruvate/2-oxoglutarate dehydrogenase complex dihydrolipoamide dehydrogenase (E3) component